MNKSLEKVACQRIIDMVGNIMLREKRLKTETVADLGGIKMYAQVAENIMLREKRLKIETVADLVWIKMYAQEIQMRLGSNGGDK